MKKLIKKYAVALTVIAAAIGLMGCNPGVEDHTHTFSETWTSDESFHWHAATCGHTEEIKDKAEHTFGEWKITTQPTEEAEGTKEHSCSVCNYKTTETVAKLEHSHAKGLHHDAVTGTCTKKGTIEYYDCVKEGCEIKLDSAGNPLSSTEGTLDPSNHTGTATTWNTTATTHKETYDCCNAVKTAEAAHTWNAGEVTKKPTFTTEGEKTYTCTVCQATKTATMVKTVYETPIDAETGLAATKSSTHVLFGVFPKTIKESSVTVDESTKITMGANIYYKGSDGEYYAKVTANPNVTTVKPTYSDGTKCSTGSVNYFKVEPIVWKVLTTNYNNSNKALLHAENVLTGNVLYYGYNTARVGDIYLRTVGTDKDIFPNNYKYSQIRAYLNGLDYYYDQDRTTTIIKTDYTGKGFLQTAFTSTAQTKIANTTVDNSENSTIDENNSVQKATGYTCANTTDKVFLLSLKEATTASYDFDPFENNTSGNSRTRLVTDYAMANHTKGNSGEAGWWWLRSPCSGLGADMVYLVSNLGIGGIQTNSSYYDPGVVPALVISLQ